MSQPMILTKTDGRALAIDLSGAVVQPGASLGARVTLELKTGPVSYDVVQTPQQIRAAREAGRLDLSTAAASARPPALGEPRPAAPRVRTAPLAAAG